MLSDWVTGTWAATDGLVDGGGDCIFLILVVFDGLLRTSETFLAYGKRLFVVLMMDATFFLHCHTGTGGGLASQGTGG